MIQSGYNDQGGNQLSTSTIGLPPLPGMGSLPFDPSAAIRKKLAMEAEERAYERQMRERAMAMQARAAKDAREAQAEEARMRERQMSMMTRDRRHNVRVDPLEGLKAQDQYEMTLRGAATRPTGLGPGMIPGMAVGPNKLPSRLRPSGSSFQGTPGPSMAGLPPSAPEPPETSHRGFDFADPYSQSAVQRASFSGTPPPRR
jgi:hypothetical protein